MSVIEVSKLSLRCPADRRARTLFAIEDGLRTSIPDDPRLVLVRSMQVPGSVGSLHPAERQSVIREGWLVAISGARHGADDSAAGANCVWFVSREEAEALLLKGLLEGRAMDGWFWKLAVPNWHGQPVRPWLRETISDALAVAGDRRLLRIAQTCLDAGAIDVLTSALDDTPERPAERYLHEALVDRPFRAKMPSSGESEDAIASAAERIERAIASALKRLVISLVRAGGTGAIIGKAILRGSVLQLSPALALAPILLAEIVERILSLCVLPESSRMRASSGRPMDLAGVREPAGPTGPKAEDSIGVPESTAETDQAPAGPVLPVSSADAPKRAQKDQKPDADDAAPSILRLRHSDHAGLWLVIPSLVELGFREWLLDRPVLLVENPGSILLHEIARHHGIAAQDPALLPLGPAPEQPPPEWARLWRHGLDRWLRRTVRRRVHDLVNRVGMLERAELALAVHYPGDSADIALRRRALDRDPGWTDWLGLSVHYHFGDIGGRP